jgi:hypothetical protein
LLNLAAMSKLILNTFEPELRMMLPCKLSSFPNF